MDGPSPRSLASLVRSVAVLALPAIDQIAWLESLGVGAVVDELALELGDGALLAPQFIDAGWLGQEVLQPLQALDAHLSEMSGPANSSEWEATSLASSPRWAVARDLARRVLLAIR